MSYAAPKGSFGRDIKGQNHPLYGSHNCKGNIHSHDPLTGKSAFLPYIPEGYVKGRSNKFKASSHNKGKNGIITELSKCYVMNLLVLNGQKEKLKN